MKEDAETIVEAFHAAWIIGDVETAMAYCHADIRVSLHYRDHALPFAGETVGWEPARRRLYQTAQAWEFLDMRQILTSVTPTVVRSLVPFVMRHKATRAVFEGTFRHVWTLQDCKVIGFDGYVDIALLKSFLRMIGLPAAKADA
ncbi:MAG: hypothetical protein ABL898_04160 [Hyphomicrobiaceae bacterium]|nr:hypothetical protein [Hyphomicrobiaceae bacterium]